MVYVVIGIISVLFMVGQVSILASVGKVLFILLWTWFLNYLCSKNLTGVAWFLVLIPYIFMILIIIFAVDIFANIAKNEGGQPQQPQQGQQPQQSQQPQQGQQMY
jgi:amino acid transporter